MKPLLTLTMALSLTACVTSTSEHASKTENNLKIKTIHACSRFALQAYEDYGDDPKQVYNLCLDGSPFSKHTTE